MYPAQQNATDQTANFFWLLAAIAMICIALWYFEKRIILIALFAFRHVEISLLQWIVLGVNAAAKFMHLPQLNDARLMAWQSIMHQANYKQVSFNDVMQESSDVGAWLRYPVAVILVGLSAYLFTHHRLARFHRNFSMSTLKKTEAANWPAITPVLSIDLLKEDIDQGPWAMAKQPIDFCRENNLLHVTEKENKKVWGMNRTQAEKLFVMQMGPLWSGMDKLPIHLKALAVVFIAKALRDEKTANNLLDQVAASAQHGQLNFTGVEELVQKYKNHRIVKWLEQRHAYVGTFMASLLEIARTDGVLASAEFLWLKPVDRRMWFLLNTVGRRTACTEAAGLFAHWKAEQKLKRPLRAPMVEQAVEALEESVNSILYVESESSWRTSNAA